MSATNKNYCRIYILNLYTIISHYSHRRILLRAGHHATRHCFIVQRYYGGRMPSTAFANNSVDLTTAFHECAISGISLTPCLFTCLISLVP